MHSQKVRRTKLNLHPLPDAALGADRWHGCRVARFGPARGRLSPACLTQDRRGHRGDAQSQSELRQRLVNRSKPHHHRIRLQRAGNEGGLKGADLRVQQLRQRAQPGDDVRVQDINFVGKLIGLRPSLGVVGVIMRHPPSLLLP